ncbi:hypothetical protein AAE478_007309 [Parahypoxylon ruwenzoriense]
MAFFWWILAVFYFSISTHAFRSGAYGQDMFPMVPPKKQDERTRIGGNEGTKLADFAHPLPTAVAEVLWNDKGNADLVKMFMNNTFGWQLATKNDSETVETFKYYSVQDYYYLLEYVNQKATAMIAYPEDSIPEFVQYQNSTAHSMVKDAAFAASFRDSLMNERTFNIPSTTIDNGHLHPAALGYAKWLQQTTKLGWYASQVARLPCIYGWPKLAASLQVVADSSGNTDTLFYREWIEQNNYNSSAVKLSNLLDTYYADYSGPRDDDIYKMVFRQAMSFEIAFFESAVGRKLSDTEGWGI